MLASDLPGIVDNLLRNMVDTGQHYTYSMASYLLGLFTTTVMATVYNDKDTHTHLNYITSTITDECRCGLASIPCSEAVNLIIIS